MRRSLDGMSAAELEEIMRSKSYDVTEPSTLTQPTPPTEPTKRTSSKQRKADLEEYKEQFLRTPKIVDRQPVFVSREVRDLLYDIVRRMGERRMSVSGFLENLSRHHLDSYAEELERWRRL